MIKFTYEKANGEISQRVGIVLAMAQKNHAILDLSDYSEDDLATIKAAYEQYTAELQLEKQRLQEKHNLVEVFKQFKAFKPEGVTNVEQV